MIKTHFYRLYSKMIGSKALLARSQKYAVVGNVLLPICCHIGFGMLYHIREMIACLCAMTD